jgi:hypothetical protein
MAHAAVPSSGNLAAMGAELDLAIAADRLAWNLLADATEAREKEERATRPGAMRRLPSDVALGLPGADGSGHYYIGAEIEALRNPRTCHGVKTANGGIRLEWRDPSPAGKQRAADIVAAHGAWTAAIASSPLKQAEADAERAAHAATDALQAIIDKVNAEPAHTAGEIALKLRALNWSLGLDDSDDPVAELERDSGEHSAIVASILRDAMRLAGKH